MGARYPPVSSFIPPMTEAGVDPVAPDCVPHRGRQVASTSLAARRRDGDVQL